MKNYNGKLFVNINKLMFTVEYAKKNWFGKITEYCGIIYADSIEEIDVMMKDKKYLWYKIYSSSVIPEKVCWSKEYLCGVRK